MRLVVVFFSRPPPPPLAKLQYLSAYDRPGSLRLPIHDVNYSYNFFFTRLAACVNANIQSSTFKTTQKLKERFLIGQNKTKSANAEEILFVKDIYNRKTINLLIFCQLNASGRKGAPLAVLSIKHSSWYRL